MLILQKNQCVRVNGSQCWARANTADTADSRYLPKQVPDKVEVRVHHRREPLGIEQRLRLRADRRKRRVRAELGVQSAHGGVQVAEHLDRADGHAVAPVALFLGLDADVEEHDLEALEQRDALLAGLAARGDLAGVGVRHKVEGQARVRGADNVCHRAAALGVERGLRV